MTLTTADVMNLIAQALKGREDVTVSLDGTLEDPSMALEFPNGQVFFVRLEADQN